MGYNNYDEQKFRLALRIISGRQGVVPLTASDWSDLGYQMPMFGRGFPSNDELLEECEGIIADTVSELFRLAKSHYGPDS